MEWNEDDYERIQEIQSMSPNFIKDAIEWWNGEANESIKRFVVVTCYYEWLALQADKADDVLADWNKEV
jgi:hypothetical protein